MTNKAEDGWWELVELVHSVRDKKQLEQLFQLLFTHEERHDLAKRLLIIRGLVTGQLPQRELAKQLQVSIAKITRGSNALKEIEDSLREVLAKGLKEEP